MKSFISALILLVSNSVQMTGQVSLERVEPMFWWTGMENKNVQLMVYGQNISDTRINIQYPGVHMERVSLVKNANYMFVDLVITEEAKPGSFDMVFTENGKTKARYTYQLLERSKNSPNREGFNSRDAIYLMMPDRFANGNTANDKVDGMIELADRSIPDMRHGGDIQGMINHLDYIENMGFTGIWLTPVLESNQPTYSYHGYAITDFYRVDPRYGTNEDYKKLVDEASKRGIKVIKDLIFNHCSHSHWWMDDLPSSDWINNMPDSAYTITNHRKTLTVDPYRAASDLTTFTDGWFVTRMPDLNQRNEHLATYLIQNSIWWIEYAGLSGIRMDTYPYPDKEMMAEWTCRLKQEYPNFNIVGEEMSNYPSIVSYWLENKINHDGYQSCLPSAMDFPIQHALVNGLTEEEGWFTGLMRMYEALAMDFHYPDPSNLVVLGDNHDMNRVYTALKEDFELWKIAMTYLITIRGIPQIYYGTEILMTGFEHEGHGKIREDFPGGWPGDEINAFTGQGLTNKQKEARDYLKKLLQWRQNQKVVHTGKLLHFIPREGVYVYFRYNEDEAVMVALNKNENDVELDMSRFEEILDSYSQGIDPISKEQYVLNMLNLHKKSALILELK